jgi:hypothetical protein
MMEDSMILGQPPIEPDVLARTLVHELAQAVQLQGSQADWTGILKEILRNMGKKLNHVVSPDPEGEEPKQFLLDLLWWKNKDVMDIVLAVESEWGKREDVWFDFGKLMVVKSPLKLMVFEKQAKETVRTIEEGYMRKYDQHIEGEYYLLLEFDTKNKVARSFHYRVPSSGRLNGVTFRILEVPFR